MFWSKRDVWKLIVSITGLLLLLIFMIWHPATLVGAHGKTSGLAPTAMVQASPTVDVTATMNALQDDKLRQEIQQLQYQNEQLKNQNSPDVIVWLPEWLRTNVSILLPTLVIVIGGLIGLFRWFGDRSSERKKRAEERFQSVIEGLGSASTSTQVGAAIMLRTFLRSGYEQFYSQTFDLAVAYLRLRNVGPEPEPADSLNQALIRVFRESFPLARDLPGQISIFQAPDALGVRLDRAYLARSDLRNARMPESYLRKANLIAANLSRANMRDANLDGADLDGADLSGSNLTGANLNEVNLQRANLKDARLRRVKGLTKVQLAAYRAKGAIVDEDIQDSPIQPPT
jgi:hypothetical protein